MKKKIIKIKSKLKETSTTEWSLLVIVISLVLFKYLTIANEQGKITPIGDFGPYPYDLYNDKKVPIGDFE